MTTVRIYNIAKVECALLKKLPPDLLVLAQGEVLTSGWNNAELARWFYVVPPQDGIQDFDFAAKPPTGLVLEVITAIAAEYTLYDIDIANYWGEGLPLLGVRVHSVHNSRECIFDNLTEREGHLAG